MIETPFGDIHGIDDETITMLELRNLFKAIDEGMAFQITYRKDTKPYKPKSFEVSKVVRCKNCKHRSEEMYDYYGNPNNKVYVCQIHDIAKRPDWFCADGEQREGEEHG